MSYPSWRSLPAMFFEVARHRGDRPFIWTKDGHSYRPMSWSEVSDAITRLAQGLLTLGISAGDRVALISENRPEWVIADFAIMSIGAITVPAYVTNTVADHTHILRNSGASAAIVSTGMLAQRVLAAATELPDVRVVITMDRHSQQLESALVRTWNDVLTVTSSSEVDQRLASLMLDDVACIIHTSGTGGAPKGVMLTHRNVMANCRGAYQLLKPLRLHEERFVSFLPLSHAYEHTAGLMFPISIGAEIYFSTAESLPTDLLLVSPTLMTAVPRLYETLYQRICAGIQREREWKRRSFEWTLRTGRKRVSGHRLSLLERLLDPGLDRLVRRKVQRRFGGQLKAMISGGAPLSVEIGSFFSGLGVRLLQGYGQSEAAPIICCNPPERVRTDTVGPPLEGVSVRIADDGEILVRGENIMKGYWNEPEETARTLIDGWLHTGDIGRLVADGYLKITDRKRDFIKNSGGEMISPAHVEGALTLAPEIAQAVVLGDRKPYLIALVVPEVDFAASYARSRGLPPDLAILAEEAEFEKLIAEVVAKVNRGLAPAERIRRFMIAREAFTIANGYLTPTLKVRRHVIRAAYELPLERLYEKTARDLPL